MITSSSRSMILFFSIIIERILIKSVSIFPVFLRSIYFNLIQYHLTLLSTVNSKGALVLVSIKNCIINSSFQYKFSDDTNFPI